MVGTTAEFNPFADHPHLGFWLVATVFKLLPAADWSGRIVGHAFYVLFLVVFFLFVRRKTSERAAVFAVLLLWIWARFSNFFSNIYLDPSCLFFGFSSLVCMDSAFERKRRSSLWALLGGISLALCAMSKGMTALGFLPAVAWTTFSHFSFSDLRKGLQIIFTYIVGAAVVLGLYYLAVKQSSVPEFFEIYFARQWTGRFSRDWDWMRVFVPSFWMALYHDAGALIFASFAGMFFPAVRRSLVLPGILFLTFVLMYAPTNRYGSNYWITVLPWVAWLAGAGLSALLKVPVGPVVKWTARFALLAVVVIQYIPVRTHGAMPSQEFKTLEHLKKSGQAKSLVIDFGSDAVDFTVTDNYFWYADLPISFLEKSAPVPKPEPGKTLLLYRPTPTRAQAIRRAGWCPHSIAEGRDIWTSDCSLAN